jgi:hypothetical protein
MTTTSSLKGCTNGLRDRGRARIAAAGPGV